MSRAAVDDILDRIDDLLNRGVELRNLKRRWRLVNRNHTGPWNLTQQRYSDTPGSRSHIANKRFIPSNHLQSSFNE